MLSPRCSPEKTRFGQFSISCRHNDDSQRSSSTRASSPRRSSASFSMKHVSSSPPPGGPGVSTSAPGSGSFKGKPTLAQEIYDEFLVCKICLEAFKNPKCLECLHTFCEQCIEAHVQSESTYKKYSDYREFTCPLCRKRTQLPIGGVKKLPDNFLVSNLSEMVGRRRVSKYPFCDICKQVDQKFRDGTAKCLDCAKMLCQSCVAEHLEVSVTSGHSIFDIEIEKNIGCTEHPEEMVRFYCVPCEVCICVLCTFKEHRQHKVTQFSDAVTSYKTAMETLVDQCLEKMDKFDSHIRALNRCEDILMTVRQKIRETAAEFVREVEKREQQLLTELDNMYGSDCLEYLERKQDLANHVENFRSTCKLAKTILGGKDIELLLMRKDVQEKLESLNMVELKTLPSSVSKVVEFVTGEVDFGYILDRDRPLLTTMTMKRKSETKSSHESPDTECKRGTKTDSVSAAKEVSFSSSRSETSSDGSSDSSDSDESSDSSDDTSTENYHRSSTKGRRVTMVERATMTDVVKLVDRAVMTKARSVLSSSSGTGNGGPNNEQGSNEKKSKKRDKVVVGQTNSAEVEVNQQTVVYVNP